jgi:hypothetical protein
MGNKKFTQPVSMACNKTEFKRDLKMPLRDLGYEPNLGDKMDGTHKYPILETRVSISLLNCKGIFCWYSKNTENGIHIDHFNPGLFLELAAVTGSAKRELYALKSARDRVVGALLDHFGCELVDGVASKAKMEKHDPVELLSRRVSKLERLDVVRKMEVALDALGKSASASARGMMSASAGRMMSDRWKELADMEIKGIKTTAPPKIGEYGILERNGFFQVVKAVLVNRWFRPKEKKYKVLRSGPNTFASFTNLVPAQRYLKKITTPDTFHPNTSPGSDKGGANV